MSTLYTEYELEKAISYVNFLYGECEGLNICPCYEARGLNVNPFYTTLFDQNHN